MRGNARINKSKLIIITRNTKAEDTVNEFG